MWPKDFHNRLVEWNALRTRCMTMPLEQCLVSVDQWWSPAPWRCYYLHMDDWSTWPTPWELLADNVFCDLARCLGIVYTLMLVEHPEITTMEMTETDVGNLVLVNHGKYILNWDHGSLLNISFPQITITKTLDSSKIEHILG